MFSVLFDIQLDVFLQDNALEKLRLIFLSKIFIQSGVCKL